MEEASESEDTEWTDATSTVASTASVAKPWVPHSPAVSVVLDNDCNEPAPAPMTARVKGGSPPKHPKALPKMLPAISFAACMSGCEAGKPRPSACVSTAFVAKTVPFLADFQTVARTMRPRPRPGPPRSTRAEGRPAIS